MHLLAAALALVAPVSGPVARGFDVGANPYEGGRHRGVDLVAPPGTSVRAPCGGEVVVAGRVGTSGRVVTLLCRGWRVTVMPLDAIAVRRGAVVRAGVRVGTVASSVAHAGVHLGVRRDGVRFGYVDPLRFLAPTRPQAPLVGPRVRRAPPVRPVAVPAPRPRPVGAPAPPRALAPWPAWVGLALVLAGAGLRWRVRVGGAWRRRTSTAAG